MAAFFFRLTQINEHQLEFQAALAKQSDQLQRTMLNQMWKRYGIASLMLGRGYFISRDVH